MPFYVDSDPDDPAIMDNPVIAAQWKSMGEMRDAMEGMERHIQPGIEWQSPHVYRRAGALVVDGGPYIVLDPPFPVYTRSGKARPQSKASLFTWTTKMSCPSFSIPAGPPRNGGTCPAAVQSAVKAEGTYLQFSEPLSAGKPYICDLCLTGDALVPVKGVGLVPLERVVEMVRDGRGISVLGDSGWTPATNAWARGFRKVLRVETSCGMRVRCTSDHKILTTGGWEKAEDLEPGDRIVLSPKAELAQGVWPEAKGIPLAVVSPAELARGEAAPAFPSEWSRELGVFLGYILGDGTVSYGRYPEVKVAIGEDDADDLRKIAAWVNEWCGSSSEVALKGNEDCTLKDGQAVKASGKMAIVAWRRLGLARLLDALGLDKRPPPEHRRVPSSVWTASASGVAGFLSGLFSTDGSVVSDERVRGKRAIILASVSEELLRDVQLLLLGFGIRSAICAYETSNRTRVRVGYLPLYKLEISAKEAVRTFGEVVRFHNARKQELLEGADLEYLKPWSTRRYAVVETVLEEPDPVEVFDIEVEHETHRFVANGLVVSNCYCGKNNYLMYVCVTANQVAHLRWLEREVARGTFARRMAEAIAAIAQDADVRRMLAKKLIDPRFFRIHDSGDFHRPDYYKAWVDVCHALPWVKFWAPTRMWVFDKWRRIFDNYPPPKNLALRPSGLFLGAPPPVVPGLDAGTTSFEGRMRAIWNCPAYAQSGDHSCAAARCRVRWTSKQKPVNYKTH